MTFDDELHTIKHDEFVAVCRCLGYDPTVVISVRLTKDKVTVVHVDEWGNLQTIRHQVVQ